MAINWDRLNVGRMDLNHSEGYFDKRHLEHERLEDLLQEKLVIINAKNEELAKSKSKKKKGNKENVSKTVEVQEVQKQVEATVKSMQKVAHGMTLRSQRQTVLTTVVGSRLMNYANVYEQHKKDLAAKKKQEEEKKVIKPFKARPAPKFILAKSATQVIKDVPAPVKPAPKAKPPVAHVAPIRRKPDVAQSNAAKSSVITQAKPKRVPLPARNSVTVVQKPKQVVSVPKPEIKKFVANVPKYLRKEPFKVTLPEKKRLTEVKPFKLSIAARIDDRHKADADRRKMQEERLKKNMEEKAKKDLEEIKRLRKEREFRASVNPFNKVTVVKKAVAKPTPTKKVPETKNRLN